MILAVVSFSSCTHRLTDFTVISTKNVPLGDDAASLEKAPNRVRGVDRAHTVLFIPFGTPNMKEAIDKAIEQYPGAVGLVDGVVKSNGWSVLLYGQSSYIVEGTPLYVEDVEDMKIPVESGSRQGNAVMFFHEVKSGETLGSIAKTYDVKVAELVKWNELSSTEISVGTKLKVFVR